MGQEDIERAFGSGFLEKYQDSLKRRRVPKLEVAGQVRQDIIAQAKADMNGSTTSIKFPYKGLMYDVVLAETPPELRIRENKYGKSAGFKWDGTWLNVNMSQEQIDSLMPETPYVLVGYIKSNKGKTDPSKTYYNMNLQGIITMDEIANFKDIVHI